MDADVIFVSVDYVGSNPTLKGIDGRVIIRTSSGGSSAGLAMTDTITDIEALSDENPTVQEVLSFLWLMLRKAKNRQGWSLKKFISKG